MDRFWIFLEVGLTGLTVTWMWNEKSVMPPKFCLNKWRGHTRTQLGSIKVEMGPGWRGLEASVFDVLYLRCWIYTQLEMSDGPLKIQVGDSGARVGR